jgi:HCOMODA/2-hydroxy-3-carboxy-muconic semialdehyde decarboxylase
MADDLRELQTDIAIANRILVNEGVLDAFGHISARHPKHPNRYLLSRSRAPELVSADDILEFDLESRLIKGSDVPLYSERVIHGEIYKARPDVHSVCHHHAPAFMPLVVCGIDYEPVFHLGGVGGVKPPFWDQRHEFGDTNLLVVKPEEGASLAKALGRHWMVLMNRHGVTTAGTSVRENVFRCVYSCRNAQFQIRAASAGTIGPLSSGEAERTAKISQQTTGLTRAWEAWAARLAIFGAAPLVPAASKRSPAKVKSPGGKQKVKPRVKTRGQRRKLR